MRKYRILAGVWFSDKKPEMHAFLRPFTDALTDLESSGIH